MGDDNLIFGGKQSTNTSGGSANSSTDSRYTYKISDRSSLPGSPFDGLLELLHYDNLGQLFGGGGSGSGADNGNPFGGNPFQFNPLAPGGNTGNYSPYNYNFGGNSGGHSGGI